MADTLRCVTSALGAWYRGTATQGTTANAPLFSRFDVVANQSQ